MILLAGLILIADCRPLINRSSDLQSEGTKYKFKNSILE